MDINGNVTGVKCLISKETKQRLNDNLRQNVLINH